jgi:hypothetical protein
MMLLEHAGQREDVADVVVHDEGFLAAQRAASTVQVTEDPALPRREVAEATVQIERRLVEQPLVRPHVLDRQTRQRALDGVDLIFGVGIAVEQQGCGPRRRVLEQSLREIQGRRVGQARIQHHALRDSPLEGRDRVGAAADRRDAHVRTAQELDELLPARGGGLDDQELARGRLGVSLDRRHRFLERLAAGERLGDDHPGAEP